MKKAFLLNNYEKRDNQFHLKGRVLSDIMIKDFLAYQDGDVEKKYIVKRILAYRHEFNIINAGMTCELILEGEPCDFIEDAILYRLEIDEEI